MTIPVAEIHAPTNLYPTSAFLHGMCRSMGGLPTKFAFGYSTPYSWHYTPWWDVDHDGEVFDYNAENIGWEPSRPFPPMIYRWPLQAYAMAYNADGTHESKRIRIWLPKPTDPKLGAPWTITAFGGSCYDHRYSFEAFTDIACRLTAYIGRRKPWVSPTTHITRGVMFHHDAIVIFRYDDALTQEEPGDAITHTYDYRYRYFDHAYWILFIGTVDGKDSPSVSAPYKFLCVTPPIMTIDDAFDITHNSAKLPGHLIDDKGLPVYCRFNYGIKPDYTADTPTLGPERHPYDYVQQITELQAETEYRFRAEGSHEVSFPYHGISPPKDFFTLVAPIVKHCFANPENIIRTDSSEGYKFAQPLLPCENIAVNSARYHVAWPGDDEKARRALFALYEADENYKPIGNPIAYDEQDISLSGPLAFIWIDFSFAVVNLIADHHYAWVAGAPYVDGNMDLFRIGYDGGLNGACNVDPTEDGYFSWWVAGEWYPWTNFGQLQRCYELEGPD